MKTIEYPTTGTCSKQINLTLDDDNRIINAEIVGGCPGNTFGLARMIEGRPASEVIALLDGVTCGAKPTSCPDQLAKALKKAIVG